ncbi:molybdopterin cofactor-binding domain-containing protein [Paraburkholderia sp. GAS348]|uniref:xanthine dehydrogenase family protein molybdopterin-binding subunit n=1 Tax=Paraburkholderia sp. GAS348 TaxID=3035132 RepID=UPI003D22BACA
MDEIVSKPGRRSFLIGSVAIVGGGVVFGPYVFANTPKAAAKPVSITPWVKISPDKITLITPHADVGQGAVAGQAILIAEELDLDLGQFDTDFGPTDKAYYNTALADELVPFLSIDDGPEAEAARAGATKMFKDAGLQMTGGSSTIRDSFTKLREAGAVVRETLKATAAKRTGVSVNRLRTASGAVILPNGKKIRYVDLAAESAKVPPMQNVKLRDPSEWRLIGKPTQRLDVASKATGKLKFGIDQSVPGMVFATVKLNPNKGAPLQSFDASKAERMPGVKGILPINNGFAVIATNTWYAMQAADAVECKWAAATDYSPEQAQHWAAVEAAFAPNNVEKVWRNDGNVNGALQGASVIEAEYRAPYLAHQPLEPLNAIAIVRDDGIELWTSHQMPDSVQAIAASVTGHKPEQVILHNQWAGGSFGHRLEFENIRAAVQIANKMRGTPVKLVFSREEDFLQDFPRQIGAARNRGMVKDGKIVAVDFYVATSSAVRSQYSRMGIKMAGADHQSPLGTGDLQYNIPNFRMTSYSVKGTSPCSSWRSVGASTGGFFGDAFIDELLHAAGVDPLKGRIDMCTSELHRKVLAAVGEMSGWNGPRAPNGGGRGVAFIESFGVPVAEVIEVSVTEKGAIRLEKVWVAAAVGKVIDPVNFENLVQGGVVFALGHAMNCELTYANGLVQQRNFNQYEGMRMFQCPKIEVRGIEAGPIRGIGEPPVPPAAPALANAIFAATGKRLREMPFNKFVEFV